MLLLAWLLKQERPWPPKTLHVIGLGSCEVPSLEQCAPLLEVRPALQLLPSLLLAALLLVLLHLSHSDRRELKLEILWTLSSAT